MDLAVTRTGQTKCGHNFDRSEPVDHGEFLVCAILEADADGEDEAAAAAAMGRVVWELA